MNTKKITTAGILTAAAIILHIVEALLPNPFPVPGVKLGLANIITLWALYSLDFSSAIIITILRVSLGSLLTGTFLSFGFFMAFAGGITSACLMALFIRLLPKTSPIGISIVGAVVHNVTQLSVASFFLEQVGVFFYLPVLLFAALPAGAVTGIFVILLRRRIPI